MPNEKSTTSPASKIPSKTDKKEPGGKPSPAYQFLTTLGIGKAAQEIVPKRKFPKD
jgi:hypothetical protein